MSRHRRIALWLLASSLITSAAAAESTVTYPAIQRAFLREDFEVVTRLSRAFLAQYPQAPEVDRVWLWLAISLDRLQRSGEALTEFELLKRRLSREEAVWPEVLFWEAEVSRRAVQMTRAKLVYQQLLEDAPSSPWAVQARFSLGLICLHQQAFQRALVHFQDVASSGRSTSLAVNARLLQGFCYLQLKQFPEAISSLELLLRQPRHPHLLAQAAFYVGESFSALGRYDEAARAYRRAIEFPEAARWSRLAQFGLGWVYAKTDRCQESVAILDRYLADGSFSFSVAEAGETVVEAPRAEALLMQGQCLLRLGRETEAVARFERLASQEPTHPAAIEGEILAIDVYRRQGQFTTARAVADTLLERSMTPALRARLHLQYGALALEQAQIEQATRVFRLAAQSPEREVQSLALGGLGDVQRFLGRPALAQQLYEEAVRVAEDSPVASAAWFQLGRLHQSAGAFAQAATVFQRLSGSDNAALADDARLALVTVYLSQREMGLASVLLETIRRRRPSPVIAGRSAYYQAVLALDAGNDLLVKQLCREAMATAPGTDEAVDALLLLADLEARAMPASDVVKRLQQEYASVPLRPSAQAKFAKRLGELAQTRGAYAEAIRWFDRAVSLWPALEGELTYRMAACYEEAEDREVAIRWYQQMNQLPWRVRGRLAAAKLLEREERPREAEAIYALLARETIPEAKVARERLAAMTEQSPTRSARR